jgi:hypothetical protein
MGARSACVAWIAPPLLAGCAATAVIDPSGPGHAPALARDESPQSPAELSGRSQAKLALGKRYLAAGEEKLGRFLLEQAHVDAELASLKAATSRLRAEALPRIARRP